MEYKDFHFLLLLLIHFAITFFFFTSFSLLFLLLYLYFDIINKWRTRDPFQVLESVRVKQSENDARLIRCRCAGLCSRDNTGVLCGRNAIYSSLVDSASGISSNYFARPPPYLMNDAIIHEICSCLTGCAPCARCERGWPTGTMSVRMNICCNLKEIMWV